ncbi:MAG: deoxyguanosinetriphosphate triphosphohydrolase [Ideonella sp.]|nr:deoxyguanosinetriphosphate triphosphohydrolase [Ideonella sp.]MCC7456256.1 deoxyguanosinetriphosphate triphosphohydrolase [Nitrospira sp.]
MSDPAPGRAAWASDPARSRGRRLAEPGARERNEFQRDRDRIVHSTAFRRLVYKTQVFVNHEGDLFRTRLTHSLEVAQLARSMARRLGLHEDLVEAIALAHDLGHAPYGHAGQDALNECMQPHGGFEHNLQSLRIVDTLEHRYPDFDGLNLCFETREGVLKHCSLRCARALEAAEPGGVGRRFVDGTLPSLEAQLVDLADQIAYNAHDLDDGIRSGLLELEMFDGVALVWQHRRDALREHPRLRADAERRLLFETLRRMLSAQVRDVIETTGAALRDANVMDADDVRRRGRLVRISEAMRRDGQALQRQLFRDLYRHPRVARNAECGRAVVRTLFEAYRADPRQLPADFAAQGDLPRAVSDYVAGMTDRFAIREFTRITGRDAFDEPAAGAAAR